jgi:hypothetical protein
MNQNRRHELLKTVSLYSMLFIVTFMITLGLLIQLAAAHPEDCGWELDYAPSYIYAQGWDNQTEYPDNYAKYGIRANTSITNPSICGHFQSDGSVGGAMVGMASASGTFIEVGWFKGNYTGHDPSMIALSRPHYFVGRKDSSGQLHYLDISSDKSIYPTVSHWANFSTNGAIDTSDLTWDVTIESADHSTITYNDQEMPSNEGWSPQVYLEFHNNMSSGTAHFKDIQNARNIAGSLSWANWGASHADWTSDSRNPYRSYEISDDEYCMYTQPGSCP